jgi:hypothetical protein
MRGILIESHINFPEILLPVREECVSWYWLLDLQAGPFQIADKPNFEELDAKLDAHFIEVAPLGHTSASLWSPGVFPELAGIVWEDEWGYFIGLCGQESEVVKTSGAIASQRPLTMEYFSIVEQKAELFIVQVCRGHWEIFSSSSERLERFINFEGAMAIESTKWGNSAER